jgi:hypothetical protein
MKACIVCQTDNLDDSNHFCTKCGSKLETIKPPVPAFDLAKDSETLDKLIISEKISQNKGKKVLAGVVTLSLAFVGFVAFAKSNDGGISQGGIPVSATYKQLLHSISDTELLYVCEQADDRSMVDAFNLQIPHEDSGKKTKISIGNNFSPTIEEQISEIKSVCSSEISNRPSAQAMSTDYVKKHPSKNDKLEAKYGSTLASWNTKAQNQGMGDLSDYFMAIESANNQIQNGAQFQMTGNGVDIQSAYCSATTNSTWINGEPGGYWVCMITYPGDISTYSIQFTSSSWGGKPDGGNMAGAELNWKFAPEFENWVMGRI